MEQEITLQIQRAQLPDGINAFTMTRQANAYTVIFNDRKPQDRQAAAFLHECLHLYHGAWRATERPQR